MTGIAMSTNIRPTSFCIENILIKIKKPPTHVQKAEKAKLELWFWKKYGALFVNKLVSWA